MLSIVLKMNNYDSVSNFIVFYNRYIKSGIPFIDFYKKYDAPILSKQYTCVGLGLELMRRMKSLDATYKDLSKSTSLLSCEESVNNGILNYVTSAEGPHKFRRVSAEKEHVCVGVQILVEGRPGVLLADPGYHVGRVVTVMLDGLFPHTGLFSQQNGEFLIKEYHYLANSINNNYVEWHEREKKNGKIKYQISLVYVGRPYLTAITVTEKRNLVYCFKSQLRRDSRGNVIAGYYFPLGADIDTATFNVFIGRRSKAKYSFKDFLDPTSIPDELVDNFRFICQYMNCSYRHLVDTICKLAKIIADKDFLHEVTVLNSQMRAVCK